MEQYLYVITVLLFPISLLLVILFSIVNRKNNKNLPPGKRGWPFIGESLELFWWGRQGVPEEFFSQRTSRYSSEIFKTSLFGEHVTVLCGAQGNKFLFSTESRRVAVWLPPSFANIFPIMFSDKDGYNGYTQRQRRLVAPLLLNPESLKKYVATIDAVAMQLMQDISATQQRQQAAVTVYPMAKRYSFEVACKVFMSIEDSNHISEIYKPFCGLFAGLFSIPINLPGFPLGCAIKASKIITNEILRIVQQRKIELSSSSTSPTSTVGKNDILFHMLTTSDENGRFMEETEIAEGMLGLLIGGHETAGTVCTYIINYMADLPQVYENVYKEQMEIARSKRAGEVLTWEDLQKMSYSWNVACEAMRLMPPAPLGFRHSSADLTFAGFSIPKATKLLWSPNSTHHDKRYFPEPKKFDPTRFQGNNIVPYSYVPFGGGPRKCPGGEYARLKILVLMHNMVKRFRWEKIIPNEKMIVDPTPRLEKGLPIRLYPH